MTTSTYSFTTAAKVKFQLENFEAGATDGEIETLISHAEGYIIALTKNIWAGTIPQIIEAATTHFAAILLLQHDPSGLSSTSEAALEADILWAILDKELTLLSDDRIVTWLKDSQ